MKRIVAFFMALSLILTLIPASVVMADDGLSEFVKSEMEKLDGITATLSPDGRYLHVEGDLSKNPNRVLNDTFSFHVYDIKYFRPISKMVTVKIPGAVDNKTTAFHYSVTIEAENGVSFESDIGPNTYFLVITGSAKYKRNNIVESAQEISYGVPIKHIVVSSVSPQQDGKTEGVYKTGKTNSTTVVYPSPKDTTVVNSDILTEDFTVFVYYAVDNFYYIEYYVKDNYHPDADDIKRTGFVEKSKIKFVEQNVRFDVKQYSVSAMQKKVAQMQRWFDVYSTTKPSPRYNLEDHIEALDRENKILFYALFFASDEELFNKGLTLRLDQLINKESFKKLVCAYAAGIYQNELSKYAGSDSVMQFLDENEGAYKKYAEPLADELYNDMCKELKNIWMYNPTLMDEATIKKLVNERLAKSVEEAIRTVYKYMTDENNPTDFDAVYKKLSKTKGYEAKFPSLEKQGASYFYNLYKGCFREGWEENFESYLSSALEGYKSVKREEIARETATWNRIRTKIQNGETPDYDIFKLRDDGTASAADIQNAYKLVYAFQKLREVTDKQMEVEKERLRQTFEQIWSANSDFMKLIEGYPDSYGKALVTIYKDVMGFDVVNLPQSYSAYLNVLCRTNDNVNIYWSGKDFSLDLITGNRDYLHQSLKNEPSNFAQVLENLTGQVFMTTYDRSQGNTFTPGCLVVFVHGTETFYTKRNPSALAGSDTTQVVPFTLDATRHCVGVYTGKGVFYIPYEADPELFDAMDYENQNVERVSIGGYEYVKITYKNEPGKDAFGTYERNLPWYEKLFYLLGGGISSLILIPDHIIEPNVAMFNFSDYSPTKYVGDIWYGLSSKEYVDLVSEEFAWQLITGWMPPPLESIFGSY